METPRKTGLSRREFLKSAGLLLASTPLILAYIERSILNAASTVMRNIAAARGLTTSVNELCSYARESENPTFRPMVEIIQEGISHSGVDRITYRQSDSFRDDDYYADALLSIAPSRTVPIPKLPSKLDQAFRDSIRGEAWLAMAESDLRDTSFGGIVSVGSGFHQRFMARHPELYNEQGHVIDYDPYFAVIDQEAEREINNAREYVENQCRDQEGPVSTAVILGYFIRLNDGELSYAIYDMALYLKFMARNNYTDGSIEFGQTQIDWYREHILDEFQGPSYTDPPEGEEVINLIGKVYHSWNIVALRRFFPINMIRVSVIYRNLSTYFSHGLGKIRADAQTLEDLEKIEKLLMQFS